MTAVESALTDFQVEVGRLFFSLPESKGFLLAGGAALVALGLSGRPTQDLDFFTSPGRADVVAAGRALVEAASRRDWSAAFVREHTTFCRLTVESSQQAVLVDLAVDSAPGRRPVMSLLGPTFSSEELAGRKTVALFDRAEARDFVDVQALASRYGKDELLAWAADVDRGFSIDVLLQMFASLARFDDAELAGLTDDVPGLRSFFLGWADELRPGPTT